MYLKEKQPHRPELQRKLRYSAQFSANLLVSLLSKEKCRWQNFCLSQNVQISGEWYSYGKSSSEKLKRLIPGKGILRTGLKNSSLSCPVSIIWILFLCCVPISLSSPEKTWQLLMGPCIWYNVLKPYRAILQYDVCDSYGFIFFSHTLLIIQILPHFLSHILIGGLISHF